MRLSCVSDEISEVFNEAVELGLKYGIRGYELRKVEGCRFPAYKREHIQSIKDTIAKHDVIITAVSPGIFKNESSPQLEDDIFSLASEFNVSTIVIFAWKVCKDVSDYKRMVETIKVFCSKAQKKSMRVLIENSAGTCCVSASDLAELLKAVAMPNFKINWDPGNAASGGYTDFREQYLSIKNDVENIHLKDVMFSNNNNQHYVPVGNGSVDYKKRLIEFKAEGYRNWAAVETHCENKEEAFIESMDFLKNKIPDGFFDE